MQVELKDIGKKFERHFVFRNVSDSFKTGDKTAILGGNGSGKSTLLKIISGSLTSTEGKIEITQNNQNLPVENYMRQVAFAGPYTEIIEEYNLEEIVAFQSQFRKWRNGLSDADVIELTRLQKVAKRPIANFSSGMRQRVRLALAILSDTPVLLLDEPTSNLDAKGMVWFQNLLADHVDDRILFVGSNHQEIETALCTREINLRK
ncbi:ABC transporter ATP-binding protein [Phaeocystidibacter luteus]|uniref:ABC transporter ATP-binding protein n=1 Tax=Phaeocystidibacter luteus TaxID=911197 RepID=A0A6N6RGP9_9FLAO|nr:ATP-binding cassette domain-containing protein [Phaeocystidibacter luteus]KAB2810283.1 ABC transporter ATP-binding protein [Phaeocystidibacter luteus]